MPWSNLEQPLGERRLVEHIGKKSQMWAGFLLTTTIFLLGFFKDNLSSITGVAFPLTTSLVMFIISMEIADYSAVNWHAILSEVLYNTSNLILFSGFFYFIYSSRILGNFALFLLLPPSVYFLLAILSLRAGWIIYKQNISKPMAEKKPNTETEKPLTEAASITCGICGTTYIPAIQGGCPNAANHPKPAA